MKSEVSSTLKPLLRTNFTASVTTEWVAVVTGGVVGGVVAGGPVEVVVCAATVVVAGDGAELDVDDDVAPGAEVELDDTVGADVVGASAFDDPPELHAVISSTARPSHVTRAGVRLEGNTFIRPDCSYCPRAGRVWGDAPAKTASTR